MATYSLVLDDWHPTWTNQVIGRHWARLHKRKQTEALIYQLEARAQGVALAMGKRTVLFRISGWADGQTLPDWDACLKVALDALVLAGLLLDDGQKGLASMPLVEYERGPKKTEIVLEDV